MNEEGESAEELGPEPLVIALFVLLTIGLTIALLASGSPFVLLAVPFFIASLYGAIANGRTAVGNGELRVVDGALHFVTGSSDRVVSHIRGARVRADGGPGAIVSFSRGMRPARNFRTGNRKRARELVRELGFERGERFDASTSAVGAIVQTLAHWLVFFGIGVGNRMLNDHPIRFLWLTPIVVLWLLRPRIEIGDDGIAVRSLGSRTFVPKSSIRGFRRVRAGGAGAIVEIDRIDAKPLRIFLGHYPLRSDGPGRMIAEALYGLEARLADLLDERAPSPATLRDFADASSASPERLRSLATDVETFRGRPIAEAELLAIVRSDEAPPHLRARAAVVLMAMESDAKSTLLRVAHSTAHPTLRVAIESLIEPDERALEAAIERLERGDR